MRPQGKGVYEECALGLEFMVVKPHPVAMIQSPSGVYFSVNTNSLKLVPVYNSNKKVKQWVT